MKQTSVAASKLLLSGHQFDRRNTCPKASSLKEMIKCGVHVYEKIVVGTIIGLPSKLFL
jgi:hypothetical protein